jgi:hypothetical protein
MSHIATGDRSHQAKIRQNECILRVLGVLRIARVLHPSGQTDLLIMREERDTPCAPQPGPKATKAFFPDDPSNVYLSYLSDHERFRVLHAGAKFASAHS